jgi:hypothetical protein
VHVRIRPLTSAHVAAATVAVTVVVVSTALGLYVAAPGTTRDGRPAQAPECVPLATPVEFVVWRSCMPEVPEPARPSGTASSPLAVIA